MKFRDLFGLRSNNIDQTLKIIRDNERHEKELLDLAALLTKDQIISEFLEWLFFQKKLYPDVKKEDLVVLQTQYFTLKGWLKE